MPRRSRFPEEHKEYAFKAIASSLEVAAMFHGIIILLIVVMIMAISFWRLRRSDKSLWFYPFCALCYFACSVLPLYGWKRGYGLSGVYGVSWSIIQSASFCLFSFMYLRIWAQEKRRSIKEHCLS